MLKRIKIYTIFSDVIKCFFAACSTTLLLCFFCEANIDITKNIVKTIVFCFFIMFFLILILQEAVSVKKRWFDVENIIETKTKDTIVKNQEIADFNRKITSVHEAGHAIMSYIMKRDSFTVNMSYTNPHIATVYKQADAEDVEKMILIKYAGAVAEEIIFGKLYLGSMGTNDSDFSNATELIKAYIVMTNPDVSKTLLSEELSKEMIEISKKLYDKAKNILSKPEI